MVPDLSGWGTRPRVLATSLLLLTSACDSAPPFTPPEPCTGGVELSVSGGTQPTFSWAPACGVAGLTVVAPQPSLSQVQTVWSIQSPGSAIAAGIRYGASPAGTEEAVSPQPLQAGRGYGVHLRGAQGQILGAAEFIP